MNYFAHGIRFLDRPWFLAGTALPDWLSVIDRRVRLRPKLMLQRANGSGSIDAELAAGAWQHFEDDRWFHKTRAFAEATAQLARLFRDFLGLGDGFRCGFLGHIASELLLDAVLIERHPERLDAYYERLCRISTAARLTEVVAHLAGQPVDVGPWLPLFCREQFLRDYADPRRLAYRLNQVLRRIKLDPLPAGIEEPLATARGIVASVRRGPAPAVTFRSSSLRLTTSNASRERQTSSTRMKYGMNMLLWTTNVEPSHDPIFDMLKECGYDGVEIPIFQLEEASFQRSGENARLAQARPHHGLPASVPNSQPDLARRGHPQGGRRPPEKGDRYVVASVGSKLLAGPFHSAIGEFTGKGPTADEWKRGKRGLRRTGRVRQASTA